MSYDAGWFRRAALLAVCVLGIAWTLSADEARPAPLSSRAAFRRPMALALSADGQWLFTANSRSGTISVLDARTNGVHGEVPAGQSLSDLITTPDGRLLATDEQAGDLIVLNAGPEPRLLGRIAIAGTPVCVRLVGPETACVARLWQHDVRLVSLGRSPRVADPVQLPFPPRLLFPLDGESWVLVADAFGGRLAVVDLARGEVTSIRPIPGHNVRGLARVGSDGVLIAHQMLNANAPTTQENVHWGNVVTNNLRTLRLAALLDPSADLLHDARLDYLGDEGAGAADPGGVDMTPGGLVVIALSGVDEVMLRGPQSGAETRLAVGACPTAVISSADGTRAFVANTLADSVFVIDLTARKVVAELSLGPRPPASAADCGEVLFRSGRLAHDGWYSCQSCHTGGHSNGQLNDNLSDGTLGTPKRVLSLLGVRDTMPYAWSGAIPDLETQIRNSIEKTMRGPAPTETQVRDLATYLRTLSPPPPVESAGPCVERGRQIFAEQGCARCHAPPAYTSPKTYDVGLADEAGMDRFNPPSLRGVGQGGPYFHDGRAATLEDVFRQFRHELRRELTRDEVTDLVRFLRTL